MSDIKIVPETYTMNFAVFGLIVGVFHFEREEKNVSFGE